MLLANFNGKELRHRAVSLRQHGFLVSVDTVQIAPSPAQLQTVIDEDDRVFSELQLEIVK